MYVTLISEQDFSHVLHTLDTGSYINVEREYGDY